MSSDYADWNWESPVLCDNGEHSTVDYMVEGQCPKCGAVQGNTQGFCADDYEGLLAQREGQSLPCVECGHSSPVADFLQIIQNYNQ